MTAVEKEPLAIFGVGEIATHLVKGIRSTGDNRKIKLYPRNRNKAKILVNEYECIIIEDRQQIIDTTRMIFLSVHPKKIEEAIGDLNFTNHHVLLSAVGAVSIHSLQEITKNVPDIVRLMPIISIETSSGAIPIYPTHALAQEFLSHLGTVVLLRSEDDFLPATAAACAHGWFYSLFEALADSLSKEGLSPEIARQIVALNARGAADYSLSDVQRDFKSISEIVGKPGTFTGMGLDLLKEKKNFEEFVMALEAVSHALRE